MKTINFFVFLAYNLFLNSNTKDTLKNKEVKNLTGLTNNKSFSKPKTQKQILKEKEKQIKKDKKLFLHDIKHNCQESCKKLKKTIETEQISKYNLMMLSDICTIFIDIIERLTDIHMSCYINPRFPEGEEKKFLQIIEKEDSIELQEIKSYLLWIIDELPYFNDINYEDNEIDTIFSCIKKMIRNFDKLIEKA